MANILLAISNRDESRYILSNLGFKVDPQNPKLYHCRYKEHRLSLVETGIGKTNIGIEITKVIAKHSYEYVLNLGAAGATMGFTQGDHVIINMTKYHDFDLSMFGYRHGQVPGYPEYFVTPERILKSFVERIPNLKISKLLTGDQFVTKRMIEDDFLVDMEGAAIFQTLYKVNVRIICFKIVSDIICGNNANIYSGFEEKYIGKYLYNLLLLILEII